MYNFDPSKYHVGGVSFELFCKCNLNCKMCEIHRYRKFEFSAIPMENVKRFLRQFKEYNPNGSIEFQTGEIFANFKSMQPYFDYCREIDQKIGFTTNGVLLDENKLLQIKDILVWIVLSLDSHIESINDFIRGGGTYRKVLEAMKILDKHNINYGISTTVSKLNADHLNPFYDFLLETGEFFQFQAFNMLSRSFFSDRDSDEFYSKYGFISRDDQAILREKLTAYLEYTKGEKTSLNKEALDSTLEYMAADNKKQLKKSVCNVYERSMIVGMGGEIRLCFDHMFFPIGNINDENFDLGEVWEGKKAQTVREKMSKCRKKCGLISCNNKELPANKYL